MAMDLTRAGFDKERIKQMDFRRSGTDYFSFEGSGKSEANEFERSLYIEAIK